MASHSKAKGIKEIAFAAAFRTLDFSGLAAAAALSAVLLYAGVPYFLLVAAFYVLAAFFTKIGAMKKGGHTLRKWRNVIANGIFPTVAAAIGSPAIFLGSLTAVASDKMAGELGQLSSRNPVMITRWDKKVLHGTNGGITPLGEAASVIAGGLFGVLGHFAFPEFPIWKSFAACAAIGFLGANFDSVLGATLENRGYMDKHVVNFLASLFGGVAGYLLLK